ncbi:MAG TPA: PAS domain S-box protein [Pyrinomonadaceae bacterium]|jgi:PAS domain S-box-containing protein
MPEKELQHQPELKETGRHTGGPQPPASEELFRFMVESVKDYAIFATDAEGRVVSWNTGAERVFGYPESEIIGRSGNILFTPEDIARGVPLRERETAAERGRAEDERWHLRRDGTRFWASGIVTPLRDEAGGLRGFVKVARDNTSRRMNEEELGISETRARALVEQSPFSIQILSPDGRTLRVNRAWEQLWGVRLEQISDYNMLEDQQLIDKGVMPYIKKGFSGEATDIPPIRYDPNETIPDRTTHKEPQRWVRAFIYPVKDSAGRVREVVLMHEDITEAKRAEAALRESEERLRAILDNTTAVVYLIDAGGRFIIINRQFGELFHLDRSEVRGKSLHEVFPAEIADGFLFNNRRVIESGRPMEFEEVVPQIDGLHHYISVKVPLQDADGTPTAVCGISTDITERKRAEALVDGQRRVLELIVQGAPLRKVLENLARVVEEQSQEGGLVSILLLDEEGLCLRHGAGPSLPDAFNEAVDGAPVAPEGGSCVAAAYRKALVITTDIATDPLWAAYRHLALEHGLRACWSTPIMSSEGNVLGTFAVYYRQTREPSPRDLQLIQLMTRTAAIAIGRERAELERERLLRSVEAERERLSYLFEQSPSFVALLRGPNHVFEIVNPSYRRLLGGRDVIGKTVREAVPEIEGQGYFELLDEVYKTGRPFAEREMRSLIRQKEGANLEEVFVDLVYQPFFGEDGKVAGIFAHGVDVTDQVRTRRKIEEAQREAEAANRLKDEFLATLSHELRTPLTAVLGWARMLRGGQLDEKTAARALEVIERNAEAQQRLVEEVLDVSRIITGKLHLSVRPVELVPVVEAAVDVVRPAAEAKGIEMEVSVATDAGLVSGDPDRLQQVVWNLLTNAVKFTDKGGKVEVRLERSGSNVMVKVRDTGIGIPTEFLPHVFDRFRQADASTKREHGGLGLGLAVVRHLVEQHGGTVAAESEGENRGATFVIELPVSAMKLKSEENGAETDNGGGSPRRNSRAPSLGGVRVLVVDDHADSRELLSLVLGDYGAKVLTASSVKEALELLRRERIDVLVSDIGMPFEDGYDLIRKVRSLSATEGGSMPALALTAYADERDRKRALSSGFQQHLSKPIEPSELIAAVSNLASLPPSHTGN